VNISDLKTDLANIEDNIKRLQGAALYLTQKIAAIEKAALEEAKKSTEEVKPDGS